MAGPILRPWLCLDEDVRAIAAIRVVAYLALKQGCWPNTGDKMDDQSRNAKPHSNDVFCACGGPLRHLNLVSRVS